MDGVFWEFYIIDQTTTLNLPGPPLEIRFFYNSSSGAFAEINKGYRLDGFNRYTAGANIKYPWELILINNKDEEDRTPYVVTMTKGDLITITLKWRQKK